MKPVLEKLILKNGPLPLPDEDGRIYFIEKKLNFCEKSSDSMIVGVKDFLKKHPKLFRIIFRLFGATFVGPGPQAALKGSAAGKIILNLGSGAIKIEEEVLNVDFYPFTNVDIVADISDLPFADNSVDAVINESVLEHVPSPEAIVKEIHRVLKPGGWLYLSAPFLASFHSSPHDYYRWTKPGLRHLLGDFEELECGIRSGPTSALVYVLSEWLGTLLSFSSSWLHQLWFMFFMVVLAPLSLLDFLIYKLPSSENIAYGFYFFGKKK